MQRNLQPPLGYASKVKYVNEFVKDGGGFDGALEVLEETLDKTSFDNIGIIVDANDKGAKSRLDKINSC